MHRLFSLLVLKFPVLHVHKYCLTKGRLGPVPIGLSNLDMYVYPHVKYQTSYENQTMNVSKLAEIPRTFYRLRERPAWRPPAPLTQNTFCLSSCLERPASAVPLCPVNLSFPLRSANYSYTQTQVGSESSLSRPACCPARAARLRCPAQAARLRCLSAP